ncbi:uncharacterized protein LOC110243633 [Exaiptasia diaphana]|uniref:Uncharacterized protein n=1 Tax=Exaiptasia diaphana TaxID=2652724 RepID=A0A913XJK8_EXADI|nr:uncharacterized protein LOC110243633 [Exaiptasia diaphana]
MKQKSEKVQRNTSQLLSDNAVLRNEVDDLKKSVQFHSDEVEQLRKENSDLKAQVQQLTTNQEQLMKSADDLEERHDNLEMYTRKYNLEIHGISEEDEEDLEEIVMKLGEAVGVEIEEDDIDIVHRMKVRVKRGPRPIIVRFMSHKIKSELYKAKKKLRRIAGLNDDLKAEKAIYINENLTTAKRKLFAEVRKLAKQNKWKNCWSLDGKIYVCKEKGFRPIKISTYAELL